MLPKSHLRLSPVFAQARDLDFVQSQIGLAEGRGSVFRSARSVRKRSARIRATHVQVRRGAHMIGRGRRTQPDPPSSKVEKQEGGAHGPLRCTVHRLVQRCRCCCRSGSPPPPLLLLLLPLLPLPLRAAAPGGRYKEHYVQRRKAKWERDIRRCSDEWRKRWRKCRGRVLEGRGMQEGTATNHRNYFIGATHELRYFAKIRYLVFSFFFSCSNFSLHQR